MRGQSAAVSFTRPPRESRSCGTSASHADRPRRASGCVRLASSAFAASRSAWASSTISESSLIVSAATSSLSARACNSWAASASAAYACGPCPFFRPSIMVRSTRARLLSTLSSTHASWSRLFMNVPSAVVS